MIYLETKTILATITVLNLATKKTAYLVGDTVYSQLPSSVLKNAFLGANWNRALKYGQGFFVAQKDQFTLQNPDQEPQVGYYKLSFDLYYDEQTNNLVPLTKTSFDQQIVGQKGFGPFLNYLIKQHNKYKESYQLVLSQDLFQTELISLTTSTEPFLNLTQFIVGPRFDYHKKGLRWKYLVKSSTVTKVEFTKHQQVIYHYDATKTTTLKEFSYIDPTKSLVYLQGRLYPHNQQDLALAIHYEAPEQIKELQAKILKQFEALGLDPRLKNLHFFNLTGDKKYLVQTLTKDKTLDYSGLMASLSNQFEQTKSNHFPIIFGDQQLRALLWERVVSATDLDDYVKNTQRFGVMFQSEWLAVAEKRQKVR